MGKQAAIRGELQDATNIGQCTRRIKAANGKMQKQFVEWVTIVGQELKAGQQLLADHGSRDDGFGKWVRDEFGWERTYAYRLIDASEVVDQLLPMGNNCKHQILPSNERQIRELICVPEDELPTVWQSICEESKESGKPITASLIKQHTQKYRNTEATQREAAEFDEDTAGDWLCDWLRAELKKWPAKSLPVAKHWIRQIIEKEF